jgi:DNA-directed RNA polymerase subunit F
MKKRYVSIPEALEILSKKDTPTEFEKDALQYVEGFSKIDEKVAKKAVTEVKKLVDLPEKVVVKLIDLKPANKEEITTVVSSYGVIISEKDLNTLVDYFNSL